MKNYAEIISIHGAKSKRSALRHDLKTRENALSELVNMVLTEAGSIKTRWGTQQYGRLEMDDAYGKTTARIIDLDGTIYFLTTGDGDDVFQLVTLDGEVVDEVANDETISIDGALAYLGNRARWFNIAENTYFPYRLGNSSLPNQGGRALYVDTVDTINYSFYNAKYGQAGDIYPLFGQGPFVNYWLASQRWVATETSFGTTTVYSSPDGNHYLSVYVDSFTEHPLSTSLVDTYMYISVYYATTYTKWIWWRFHVHEAVDNTTHFNFKSYEAPVLAFDDNSGDNPPDLLTGKLFTDGTYKSAIFFNPCPELDKAPNHVTTYNDRVVMAYDHWLVAGSVGKGLAFDSRNSSDAYAFSVELRDEFGLLKWVIGRENALLLGTTRGIYKLDTSAGFAASTIGTPYQQSSTPVADMEPAWFGDFVIFVGADKKNLFEISYSNEQQNYITRSITADFDFPENTEVIQIISSHRSSNYLFTVLNTGRVYVYAAAADRVTFGWSEIAFRGHCDYIFTHGIKYYFIVRNNVQCYILTTIDPEIRYNQTVGIYDDGDHDVNERVVGWDGILDVQKSFPGPVELSGYVACSAPLVAPTATDPVLLVIDDGLGLADDDFIIMSDMDQEAMPNFANRVFLLKNGSAGAGNTTFELYDEINSGPYLIGASGSGQTAADWTPVYGWVTEANYGPLAYQDWHDQNFFAGGDNGDFFANIKTLYRYSADDDWREDIDSAVYLVESTGTVQPSKHAKDYIVGVSMPDPHAITMRIPPAIFDRFRIPIIDIALNDTQTLLIGNDADDAKEIDLTDDVILDSAPARFTGVKRVYVDQSHNRMGEVWIGVDSPKQLEIFGARYFIEGEEE